MSETGKNDPVATPVEASRSPLNVRCDAAVSAWDGALSGMYLETLVALSRLRIH